MLAVGPIGHIALRHADLLRERRLRDAQFPKGAGGERVVCRLVHDRLAYGFSIQPVNGLSIVSSWQSKGMPIRAPNERLTEAREKAGFATAADAARALGVKLPTYYSHENGTSGLRPDVAAKYARKFRVSLEWLLTGKGEAPTTGVVPFDNELEGLPLLGNIQAGAWVEAADAQEGAGTEMVQVVRDPRFPHARQYALRVVGDSMDLEYPDGSIVTCVSFSDSGLAIAEGMIVHVERHRAGGQFVEITLKQVQRRNGRLYLVPRSTNPKHRPLDLESSDGETEIVCKGVVLGGWAPRPLSVR